MGEIELLNKAFSDFAEASKTLEEYYKGLENQVRSLRLEVEEKNRALEKSLAETERSRRFLNNILDGIPTAILVFNQEGKILHSNCASKKLLGDAFSFDNVLDLPFDIAESEVVIDCNGTKPAHAMINYSGVGNVGSVLVIQDITRLKELEYQAELNRRLAAMGELVAKIAHEIRNPLGSIELFASMLSHDLGDSPLREVADGISTGVKTLVNTLNNMLMYTRTRKITRVSLDLKSVLNEFLSGIVPLAERNKIKVALVVEPGDAVASMDGDAELIKQVLYNLSINAVHSMPDGGNLSFILDTSSEGYLRLLVKDTGSGIAPESLDSVFDPFFSTKDRGNGLGLSIVRMIMKEHDGSVDVSSRLEEGTEFTLIFPRTESEGENYA